MIISGCGGISVDHGNYGLINIKCDCTMVTYAGRLNVHDEDKNYCHIVNFEFTEWV